MSLLKRLRLNTLAHFTILEKVQVPHKYQSTCKMQLSPFTIRIHFFLRYIYNNNNNNLILLRRKLAYGYDQMRRTLNLQYVYSCFDKGCPKKRKSVRDNAER